jgi:hypothetical protein
MSLKRETLGSLAWPRRYLLRAEEEEGLGLADAPEASPARVGLGHLPQETLLDDSASSEPHILLFNNDFKEQHQTRQNETKAILSTHGDRMHERKKR